MGESFTTHILFRTLEAIVLFLEEPNVQNQARIQKISQVKIQWLKERYFLPYTHAMLCALIEMLSDDEVHELVVDELHRFSHLEGALIQMDFKSIVRIFMNRLQTLTLDDVSGGKITVMGLLETRGMSYEGVIVVDFNEGFVPHKSQKDLFLNTKTRLHASLPTSSDREGLQKHYYSMLFNRAKKVFVACVQNSESVPSRFLLQLGISSITAACAYERVLFDAVANPIREVEEIQSDYDFKQHPLSASGLKSFLTCKRQFYYGRIAKIKEHELPRDLSQERDIGNILHQKLELLYAKQPRYENASALKSALSEVWESQGDDALGRYTKRLWLEKLDPFYDNEANRFSQGYSVAYIEKEGLATVEGISLVGRMDRIDERKGVLEVIDYKSGKFADTTKPPKESDVDYQLSVYALMAREFGEVGACGYYDLSCGELKAEQFLEDKIESLKKILRDMGSKNTWTWSLSEDVSSCRYCPYTYLCHREAYRGI
jgi:RecB family exonuclease